MRMLPAEMRGGAVDGNQIGSSGLAGVHTKVLFGDPSKAGFYSILLFVPAHTTIQGHSHRDDRMATVVSGTWLLRLWRPFRREIPQEASAGQCLFGAGRSQPLRPHGQGRCHFSNLGVWSDRHALFQSSRRTETSTIEVRSLRAVFAGREIGGVIGIADATMAFAYSFRPPPPDPPKTRSSANRKQSHSADGSHLVRIMAPCQQLMKSEASRSGSSSATSCPPPGPKRSKPQPWCSRAGHLRRSAVRERRGAPDLPPTKY